MSLMRLEFKEDFARSAERFKAFWAREALDGPMVEVVAPRRPGVPKGTQRILDGPTWADPQPTLDQMQAHFAGNYYAGDAYPFWYPNLGPGTLGGFLGNAIHFDVPHDTSWQHPLIADLAQMRWQIDEQNPYWQATLAWTRRIAARAPDRFIVGMADLGMGADVLAQLRGPENFCLDLVESPQAVSDALRAVRGLWQQCYQRLYDLFPPGNGSCCWLPAWAPGRSFPLQNDFSCMVSREMYEKFFLEDLIAHCRFLDYPVYHLDGPGAVKHLDLLLDIPELKAIQWTAGDGQPPMPHWVGMLRRIQAAGKGLVLYVSPRELDVLTAQLQPEGVIYLLWVDTPEQADGIVRGMRG
jgi:hypothetical protein